MTGEEDSLKHQQPSPRDDDDCPECGKPKDDQIWRGGEDLDAELEDLDGLVEGVAIVYDRPSPKDGHDCRNDGEPAHESILDGIAMCGAVKAADEGV